MRTVAVTGEFNNRTNICFVNYSTQRGFVPEFMTIVVDILLETLPRRHDVLTN